MNDVIIERLKKRVDLNFLNVDLELKQFYVAGSCLRAEPANDIDLFPVNKGDFSNIHKKLQESERSYYKTKNALTVKFDGVTYQFCDYYHESIEELVDSFDFAHVQIGCKVSNFLDEFTYSVYMSDAFKESQILQRTWFTGSEYPLSSLMRLPKYRDRGYYQQNSYKVEILRILSAVMNRGFHNYGDFKDQLDAVDLGLLDLELQEADEYLIDIFNRLVHKEDCNETGHS